MAKVCGMIVGAVVALGLAPGAGAVVVFSQPPSGIFSIPSVFDGPPGTKLQKADDFALLANATVTHVQWWGRYPADAVVPDNFVLRFYADNGSGLPQAVPFDQATPVGLVRTALPPDVVGTLFHYEADLSTPVALAGGTPYYFSVVNGVPGGGWSWQTAGSAPLGASEVRIADGDAWINNDQTSIFNMAFALEAPGAAIPEPLSVALTLVALAGLAYGVGRRHSAPHEG